MTMAPCNAGGKRQSITTASGDASADLRPLESSANGNGVKISMAKTDKKLTKLVDIVNNFSHVIKELKTAYDAVQQQNVAELTDGELDKNPPEQNKTIDDINNSVGFH